MRRIALPLLLLCLALPVSLRAEVDDSSLFMAAFTAFQHKDYLDSVEKLNQLDRLFPDSPLRDVSLVMLARAHQRSGDNDAAGRTINRFLAEFSGNSLSASVEDELIALGKRQKNGEKLLPNRNLHLAAQKVRNEQLARERALAEKLERERQARERAERERIAKERAEAERREQERLAAIKAERDAIRFDFEPVAARPVVAAGSTAAIPFTLVNRSMRHEEFVLAAQPPAGTEAVVVAAHEPSQPVRTAALKPKETFSGVVSFAVPPDQVDGARLNLTVKASSTRFNDIEQHQVIQALVAAPLLRVVSRLEKAQAVPGEQLAYKVSVLNAGSQPAKEVDLRITLPARLKLLNAGDNGCWVENEQTAACRVGEISQGTMAERTLTVQVRDGGEEQKLRTTVDLVQTVLQQRQSFPGAPFAVVKP